MRKYYFCVDKRGLLFNDEFVKSGLRNIATALKDKTFLDVTFKMLRPLKPDDYLINNNHKYTHISPCRGELNYVRCLDPNSSLVFTSLENRENILSYAGNLTHPFDVNLLRVHNGYMYHKITHHRHLKDTYGLLHPDIAFHLTSTTTCESQSGGTCQEENFFIHYKGKNHLICDQELN